MSALFAAEATFCEMVMKHDSGGNRPCPSLSIVDAQPKTLLHKKTDGGTDAARNLEINHLKCHRKPLYAEKDDIYFVKPGA